MKISEVLRILIAEKIFRRTSSGRSLTEYAVETIMAALDDKKNYDQEAIMCLNCHIIVSSLLVPEGCPNCGSKDLSTNITTTDIL